MRIDAVTLHGVVGSPTLKLTAIAGGLNVIYGPPRSGKTLVADLLGQALFGKNLVSSQGADQLPPTGEATISSDLGRHRVRRYYDADGKPHLSMAVMNQAAAVDRSTMRQLVGSLPAAVLTPLCALSFRQPPDVSRLLSAEFARGYQAVSGESSMHTSRRAAELAARRDLLAHELETRIADDRRASKDLEARWRELDRSIRNEHQQFAVLEQRMAAVESALAETDARLRYRRLELNIELRWQAEQPDESDAPLAAVDEQIGRLRTMLGELAQREANVRARLAQLQASDAVEGGTFGPQRQWLAVSRQLAADLAGEVSRLARASAPGQCVCRDAHSRLRPIAETIERQLDVLEKLTESQQCAMATAELQSDVDHLTGSQAELRRHLEQLLRRRQSYADGSATRARGRGNGEAGRDKGGSDSGFSAADAEQLESRRLELEQERLQLAQQSAAHARNLRDLRAQRDTVERQRAALLSARSIEHVQREFNGVQRKLEEATNDLLPISEMAISPGSPARASDYLAQLTDGELVRLLLVEQGRRACVVNRAGETFRVEALTAAQRDQVYLSLCLALVSAAARQGVWLPLVLDEPFERLDGRSTATLAAVLEDFSRQGHQVLVFTASSAAAERLASLGAAVHDMARASRRTLETVHSAASTDRQHTAAQQADNPKKRKTKSRGAKDRQRKVDSTRPATNGDDSHRGQSDAA